jgi:hypothetical protein
VLTIWTKTKNAVGSGQAKQGRLQPPSPLTSASTPTRPALAAGDSLMSSQLVCFDSRLEVAPAPNGGKSADKVSKFKWRPLGETGEFMWIDKKVLQVDRSYQRAEEYKKSIRMAADWKWESCGAISVMRRDCSFFVVDGQNRTLAAWRRSDIASLPCMVFESRGIKHEASAFIDMNTNRKPVSAYTKFKAKIIAGDETACAINAALVANGLTLKPNGNTPGYITCIASCERLYRLNRPGFDLILALATQLAYADNVGPCGVLLGGLSIIDRKVIGGLNQQKLIQRLHSIGAIALVDAARKMTLRTGVGGERVWADGMLEVVNRVRGSKFLVKS